MALQVKEDWLQFLTTASIPGDAAANYATTFAENRITESLFPQLDRQFLTQLRITVISDILCILKATEHPPTSPLPNPLNKIIAPSFTKYAPVTPPQVVSKITHPQFRKVKIGWNVFKQITAISPHQIAAHLYNPHDDSVQNIIINTVVDVFQLTEYDLFKVIEFKRLLKHLTHRSWHAFWKYHTASHRVNLRIYCPLNVSCYRLRILLSRLSI